MKCNWNKDYVMFVIINKIKYIQLEFLNLIRKLNII